MWCEAFIRVIEPSDEVERDRAGAEASTYIFQSALVARLMLSFDALEKIREEKRGKYPPRLAEGRDAEGEARDERHDVWRGDHVA